MTAIFSGIHGNPMGPIGILWGPFFTDYDASDCNPENPAIFSDASGVVHHLRNA